MVPVPVPGLARTAPGMLLRGKGPLFLRWGYLPTLLPWLRRYLANGRDDRVRHIAAALMPVIGDSLEEHESLSRGTAAAARIRPAPYLMAYRDRAAFEAHQLRTQASDWARVTEGCPRDYEVTEA